MQYKKYAFDHINSHSATLRLHDHVPTYLVADEGFEPPVQFCQTPAYETGEIGHFSNPRYL